MRELFDDFIEKPARLAITDAGRKRLDEYRS